MIRQLSGPIKFLHTSITDGDCAQSVTDTDVVKALRVSLELFFGQRTLSVIHEATFDSVCW
eukprot:m.501712 g.501712  ORF g.501712 m.501712 type:complete len:61 (+) comp57333_c0_seq14:1204-1386(+)